MISATDKEENTQYLKAAKLCLTCGGYFHKSFIPSHAKQCLKKQFDVSPVGSARSYTSNISNEAVSTDSLPCANCHKSIPQEKLEHHLRICGISRVSSPPPKEQSRPTVSFQFEHSEPPKVINIMKPNNMQFKYEQEAVNLDEPEADYEEDFEQVDQEAQEPPNEYPDVQGKVVLVGNEHVPEQAPDTVDTRVKCNICDRKYNPDSYERHLPGCQKLAARRGKVFDMAKKRMEGTDLEKFARLKGAIENTSKSTSKKATKRHDDAVIPTLNKPGKPNESPLAQSIKLAKTLRKIEPSEDIEIYTPKEQHHEAPAEKPKHKRFGPPPIETTACVYCERKFSQEASERHVPICRALYEKSKLKQGSSSTKSSPKMIRKDREGYGYAKDSASSIMSKKEELDMALKRRTQFQPPLPNQRKQTIASAAKINEASSFCHDCGSMFATPKARFCVECGSHR